MWIKVLWGSLENLERPFLNSLFTKRKRNDKTELQPSFGRFSRVSGQLSVGGGLRNSNQHLRNVAHQQDKLDI